MDTEQIKEESRYITVKNAITINAINFTSREIDVISCILGGRAPKKIASFLSIAPRTVEIHIRNIMIKVGCNSRESIIDFIEKSNKLNELKSHYFHLLINLTFTKELKKISIVTKEKNINCLIIYYKAQTTKKEVINALEEHLLLTGIKVTSKTWEKDRVNAYINNNFGTGQLNHIIYLLDDEFVERLQGTEDKIIKEIKSLTCKFNNTENSIIFLFPGNNNTKNFYEKSTEFTQIKLLCSENYYFLFFELLKNLLFPHNIDKNLIEFKKQCETLGGGSVYSLQKSTKDNEYQPSSTLIKINHLIKTFHLKWLIFLISPICFSFVVFNINKKIESLNNKPQNIESTITKYYQDNNINNETKTEIFNLPLRNTNFTGRKQALTQIKEQLNQQKLGVITQAISGLGGIGKTQLALEFAYQAAERKDYSAIFWIPAETTDSMRTGYETIAKQLHINTDGLKLEQIQSLIHSRITELHQNSKILFVLDNVTNYVYISNFLAKANMELSPFLVSHVLITSRSQSWEGTSMTLDIFTPEEALSFAQKYLPNENERAINRLTKALQFFPLALGQAVTYIKNHTNIKDYLELYANKQQDYLDKFLGNKNQYNESLWKTWNIAISKLSNSAKEVLFISAYLEPDNIPFEFFEELSTEKRTISIEELRKYSFITIANNKTFRIHRLLQEVIRLSINHNTKHTINLFDKVFKTDDIWLNKAMNLLKTKFDFDYLQPKQWKNCGKYLAHAQSIVHYVVTPSDTISQEGLKLYINIAMYLTHIQKDWGEAIVVWQKILELVKKHYCNDKSAILMLASINTNISNIERHTNNVIKANAHLEKTVLIYQSKTPKLSTQVEKLLPYLRWDRNLNSYDGIKYDYVFALLNYANVKRDLADYENAKLLYEEAFKLLNTKGLATSKIYKLSLLHNMGDFYRCCGDINKAKKTLNSAKELVDKYFINHLEQAYVYEDIANLFYYIGQYNVAKKFLNISLKIRTSTQSQETYRIGYAKYILGAVLCSSGHIDESIINLKQAEMIYNKNFKEKNYRFALLYLQMSHAFEMHKEYDKALLYFTSGQEIAENHWGNKSCVILSQIFSPIEKFPTLETFKKDIKYYIKALNLTKKTFGEESIRVARYNYLLGQTYENILDKSKAKLYYQEALRIANNQHFHNKELIIGNQKNIELITKHLKK